MKVSSNIAIFIDYENLFKNEIRSVDSVLDKLRDSGRVLIKRAYADWENHRNARRDMLKLTIEPIELPTYNIRGKNSADIRLVVDALEVALTLDYIDTIVIVASDSDYVPLVSKLRALNKKVVVFATEGDTSSFLKGFCDEIYYHSNLNQSKPQIELNSGLAKAFELLLHAVNSLSDKGAKCTASAVKEAMKRIDPTFDEGAFNFSQFTKFLKEAESKKIVTLAEGDPVGWIVGNAENSDSNLQKSDSDIRTKFLKRIKDEKNTQLAINCLVSMVKKFNQLQIQIRKVNVEEYFKEGYPDIEVKKLGFDRFNTLLQLAFNAGLISMKKEFGVDDSLQVNAAVDIVKAAPDDYKMPMQVIANMLCSKAHSGGGYLKKDTHLIVFDGIVKALASLKESSVNYEAFLSLCQANLPQEITNSDIIKVYFLLLSAKALGTKVQEIDGRKEFQVKGNPTIMRGDMIKLHNTFLIKEFEKTESLKSINKKEFEMFLIPMN